MLESTADHTLTFMFKIFFRLHFILQELFPFPCSGPTCAIEGILLTEFNTGRLGIWVQWYIAQILSEENESHCSLSQIFCSFFLIFCSGSSFPVQNETKTNKTFLTECVQKHDQPDLSGEWSGLQCKWRLEVFSFWDGSTVRAGRPGRCEPLPATLPTPAAAVYALRPGYEDVPIEE